MQECCVYFQQTNYLQEVLAKATIEVFQQQTENKLNNANGHMQPTLVVR